MTQKEVLLFNMRNICTALAMTPKAVIPFFLKMGAVPNYPTTQESYDIERGVFFIRDWGAA